MAPTWRETFNAWEKAVAPGLEQLTASDGFRDLMAAGLKMNSAVTSEMERVSRRWLHMWNLPTASDVRRLRRQVTSLDREVKALRRSVDAAVDALAAQQTGGLGFLDDGLGDGGLAPSVFTTDIAEAPAPPVAAHAETEHDIDLDDVATSTIDLASTR